MITLLIISLIVLVIAIILVVCDCESAVVPFVLVVTGVVSFSFYIALSTITD